MPDELFDVVDENGSMQGYTISKKDAHAEGVWHQTVDVWIYNTEGEVLLQKRSMSKESYPGLLDISAAGHVSVGETRIQAALRELEEELGIKAEAGELKEILASKLSGEPKPGYYNKHVYTVYLLKRDTLPQTLQKEEVESVEFIPLARLEKEIGDPELTKKYVQRDYYPGLIRAIRAALSGVQGL